MSKDVVVGQTASSEVQAPPVTELKTAPMFHVEASSPRELMVKAAAAILKTGVFEMRQTNPKDPKTPKSDYLIWNMDDSGKIGEYNNGITLTAAEARLLPTIKGLPLVFTGGFVLRQLTPQAVFAARNTERQLATATREANKVAGASDDAILAELNARRAAKGLPPIEL